MTTNTATRRRAHKEMKRMTIAEFTKNVDARPFYAVVGVTDLSVEKAREAAATAEVRRDQLRAELDKLVADLKPAKVQDRALATFAQVRELPTAVVTHGKANAEHASARYDALAARGKKLVDRIRRQQATKDLMAQAETTVAQAKGAVTTARKAAADVERSAKATFTTGRNEAAKAVEAITTSVTDEVRNAEAEAAAAAKRTRTAAKRTATTARKATDRTTASAKGVATSATKAAEATRKATFKAAEKVGA